MNIVIVGGGTAGWLAALIVSKRKPHHTVTVIESPTVGIIGAAGWPLWSYILGGTGNLTPAVAQKHLEVFRMTANAAVEHFAFVVYTESMFAHLPNNNDSIRSRQKAI